MLRGLFAKRAGTPPAPARAETERVRALARTLLDADEATEITVSEIVCLDPSCPGSETVLLVMRPGEKTRAAKVARPAADVAEPDLAAAFEEAGLGVDR